MAPVLSFSIMSSTSVQNSYNCATKLHACLEPFDGEIIFSPWQATTISFRSSSAPIPRPTAVHTWSSKCLIVYFQMLDSRSDLRSINPATSSTIGFTTTSRVALLATASHPQFHFLTNKSPLMSLLSPCWCLFWLTMPRA